VSQYPNPYNAPQAPIGYGGQSPYGYAQDPAAQALAPCRRAAVLMFVLGGLLLLIGGCMAAAVNIPGVEEQIAKQPGALPPGKTFAETRSEFSIVGGTMLGIAVLELALGGFVRRGSRGAAIGGIVLTFLVLGYLALDLFAGMSQGMPNVVMMGLCVLAVPIALLVWQLVWLFQANAAAGRWSAWQAQYAGQYYQYQQQQQMQGQYPPPQQQQYPPPPSQQPQYWQQPQQPPQQPPQNWGPPPGQ
jgi:hypothetical protein